MEGGVWLGEMDEMGEMGEMDGMDHMDGPSRGPLDGASIPTIRSMASIQPVAFLPNKEQP